MLAAMVLVLCLGAGAALAVGDSGQGITKTCRPDCTEYPDTLKGTSAANTINASGGKESPTFGALVLAYGFLSLLRQQSKATTRVAQVSPP